MAQTTKYRVTVDSETERHQEDYTDLIDAANAFAVEAGGEEITSICSEPQSVSGHCVGDGQEVAEDFELFGTLVVSVPECDYTATLEKVRICAVHSGSVHPDPSNCTYCASGAAR